MKSCLKLFSCVSVVTVLSFCLCSCSSREEMMSREELEKRGIPFEVNTLFYYIEKDNFEVVELFLKAGMDVDEHKMYKDVLEMEAPPFTETPLIQASGLGNLRLVRLFIEHGADVDAQNGYKGGFTPLMYAAMGGHGEVAAYLLGKGADVEMYAFSPRVTALMIAADYGHVNVVKILLDAGADINAQSYPANRKAAEKTDKTALMYASAIHCIDYIYDGDQKQRQRPHNVAVIEQCAMIKMLAARGADFNKQTDTGWTALMFATKDACDYNYTEIVRTLLECGADRNKRNNDGDTALMLAEKIGNTSNELIALLKK